MKLKEVGTKLVWDEETIFRLRALWDEGLSTAEIGRRLGCSKNAVVGKAHRLELARRPSPIHAAGTGNPNSWRNRLPRPGRNATLPKLQSLQDPSPPQVRAPSPVSVPKIVRRAAIPKFTYGPGAETGQPTAATGVLIAPRKQAEPPTYGRVQPCCWPKTQDKPFRFCCEPSEPGRVYCTEHCDKAYIRVRDRREDNPAAFSYNKRTIRQVA